MANRYWVGGTGTWNTTSTTNWSASSGGASGASAPTSADVVIFDANSNVGTGSFTVTINQNVNVNSLLIGASDVSPNTALDGAMTLAIGTFTLTISGAAFNVPATNLTITGTGPITLLLDPIATYIDTHGYVIPNPMVIAGGTGEEVFLSNDLTISNTLTFTSGILRLNQKNISCTRFISSNTNTRELILTWNGVDSKIFLTSAVAGETIVDMGVTTNLTVTGGGTTGGFYRNQTVTSSVQIGWSSGGTTARTVNLFITGGSAQLTLSSGAYFKKLDFTGSSCNVVNSASTPLFVSGDVILSSTGTYTGLEITFNGSSTVTSNGKTLQDIIVNAAGITVSLADAFSCAVFTLTQGTFNTNSFNVTTTSTSVTGTSARTLTMGSSTWTVTEFSTTIWNATTTTNLTFNAGTSTISLTSASAKTFVGGGLTYYNLNQGGTGALTITGSNTFNDITDTAQPATITFTAGTTQTVSNFTVSGIDGALVNLQSSTAGTQFTLSKSSGAVAIQHVSIRDCNATGGATWSATNSADISNNTGWTITVGPPKYWVGGTASWDETAGTKWSLNSGGTGGAAIPTAANPVVFDSASGSGTVTQTLSTLVIASLNFTGFTGTFAGTASITINGSFILGSGMTNSRTGPTVLIGTGTLTSAGKTIGALTIDALGRTITLGDAFNSAGNAAVTLTNGTLDLNNFTLSVGTFSSDNSNVRSIAFGATGDIYLRTTTASATVLAMNTATNFTFTGTSSVSSPMNVARSYFFGSTAGATDSNRLSINIVSGAAFPNLVGTYRNLNFTGFTGSLSAATFSCHGFTLSSGGGFGNITFLMVGSGSLNFAGNTAGNININTAGITTTLASAGSILTLLTLTNGTLDLAGFTLTTPQTTTAAGTKNLTFNGGTLAITGTTTAAWNNAQPTGFTTTAGTGTGVISMTAATAKTFTGAGSVYNCTLNQGGAGALTITGSNTFDNITNTVQPATVTFTSGTTSTFLSGFSLSGTPGNLISIASSTTTNHTLTKASGTISVSYCSITRSSATGGARWQAYTINGNIDGSSPGVNTGWIFTAPSSTGFFDFF